MYARSALRTLHSFAAAAGQAARRHSKPIVAACIAQFASLPQARAPELPGEGCDSEPPLLSSNLPASPQPLLLGALGDGTPIEVGPMSGDDGVDELLGVALDSELRPLAAQEGHALFAAVAPVTICVRAEHQGTLQVLGTASMDCGSGDTCFIHPMLVRGHPHATDVAAYLAAGQLETARRRGNTCATVVAPTAMEQELWLAVAAQLGLRASVDIHFLPPCTFTPRVKVELNRRAQAT